MTTTNNFEAWFNAKKEAGLVDIKFSIYSTASASVRSIQDEILATDAVVKAGLLCETPTPSNDLPEHIKRYFFESPKFQ